MNLYASALELRTNPNDPGEEEGDAPASAGGGGFAAGAERRVDARANANRGGGAYKEFLGACETWRKRLGLRAVYAPFATGPKRPKEPRDRESAAKARARRAERRAAFKEAKARKAAAVLGHNYPGSDWYLDSYAVATGSDLREKSEEKGFFGRTWDRLF